ncbi:glycosyltransferase, partial [bacterium]|nr:glycosyltransferase [bacterium]
MKVCGFENTVKQYCSIAVVIVAGGTGGHLFPGLVIAEKLKQGEVGCAITFIGRRRGLEAETVPREGFAYLNILGEGWLGKSPGRLLSSVIKTLLGFFQSIYILLRLRPNVVVGMGGYLSGPFVLAASLLARLSRNPFQPRRHFHGVLFHTLIHEQNLMPGITNRILSRFVNEVNVSFAESMPFFPNGKAVFTGNPVRGEIVRSQKRKSESAKTILVMGGSRGAHRINVSMLEA